MDHQQVEYFLEIAKQKNLTRAAQTLYISQPALTKYVQRLEKKLGGKIFRGNYELTYLGRRYMEYAQSVINLNRDWERELSDIQASSEGELNIAFPPMRAVCMVPPILREFHSRYPNIHVNIYDQEHDIQELVLNDGNLDFAIYSNWQPVHGLRYEVLDVEEIVLILPEKHALSQAGTALKGYEHPWLDLERLRDTPFVLHYPEQNTGRAAMELFRQYGIRPLVPFRSRSSRLCIELAVKSGYACFAPAMYALHYQKQWGYRIFSTGNPVQVNQLVIAYREDAYLSTYARDFIRLAQQTQRNLGRENF